MLRQERPPKLQSIRVEGLSLRLAEAGHNPEALNPCHHHVDHGVGLEAAVRLGRRTESSVAAYLAPRQERLINFSLIGWP